MKLPRWGPVSRSSDLLSQSCPLVVGFVRAGTLKGQETQTHPQELGWIWLVKCEDDLPVRAQQRPITGVAGSS